MKTYQLFISIFVSIFLSFFLAATASATISCSGQNCTDNFNSGFGSWSDNSIPQQETAICGASCNSVKLANTTQSSPDGRLSKSFTVTPGATYRVSIKAGVYTDGANPDGFVTLTAVSGNSQANWCNNNTCTALGSSINGSLSVTITPDNSTLSVYLDGNQGGCDVSFGNCHDPFVDDFSLTKTADAPAPASPSAPTNLLANCPPPGTTGTLNWTNGTGAAYHNLRIDNKANGWSGNCSSLNPGDLCFDPASPGNFSSQAGATYSWWVDACNSSGCTTGSGSNFTCQSTLAPQILASDCTGTPNPGQINQPITWNVSNVIGGSGTYTYTWSGDDGLSSTTSGTTATSNSVNKTYTTVGTGTKNASVTISSGTSTPITKTCSVIITAPAPTVSLSASPTSGTTPLTTTLTWVITGTATSCTVSNSDTATIISGSWSGTLTGSDITSGSHTRPISLTSSSGTQSKTFSIYCSNATGSSPTRDVSVSVSAAGTPAAPAVSTSLSCIPSGYTGSGVTITYGSRTPPVIWADISSSSTFSSYYHKDVSGTTSTTAPNGFNAFPGGSSLSLNPDTSYYVRVNNGARDSGVNSFSIPSCAAPTPAPTSIPGPGPTCGNSICEAGETTASCPTDCPASPGGTCGNSICETGETTLSCPADCPPGGPVCGDSKCEGGEPLSCPQDCTVPAGSRPWIQTTGGDVHSNTRIYTPGGP